MVKIFQNVYSIFDQINAALESKRDFFQKHFKIQIENKAAEVGQIQEEAANKRRKIKEGMRWETSDFIHRLICHIWVEC